MEVGIERTHQAWLPREKKTSPLSAPSSPSATTAAVSDSHHSSTQDAANTTITAGTSADSRIVEDEGVAKMDNATTTGQFPDQNRGRSPASAPVPPTTTTKNLQNDDNTNRPVVVATTYTWTLPSSSNSNNIIPAPAERAASPSTASSASSTSDEEDDSATTSLALFIRNQIKQLHESPRPILASQQLSRLRSVRPEARISRWIIDVEAQQQEVGNGSTRRNVRGAESGKLVGGSGSGSEGERTYGTLVTNAEPSPRRVAKRSQDMREDEDYEGDAQASEDEDECDFGCACGTGCSCWCGWQWVMLTILVLALIAWGLWAFLGDRDIVGAKEVLLSEI